VLIVAKGTERPSTLDQGTKRPQKEASEDGQHAATACNTASFHEDRLGTGHSDESLLGREEDWEASGAGNPVMD
jgi:hypothetical protein